MDHRKAQLETLRSLLKQLGITPEQLLADTTAASVAVPTFDEYVWQVAEAVSPGTRRVYSSYWQRICQHWGTRRITEPTPLEIKRLVGATADMDEKAAHRWDQVAYPGRCAVAGRAAAVRDLADGLWAVPSLAA